MEWANETIDTVMGQTPGPTGLDKVGRALQADTATHGLTFKDNNLKFKAATEEVQQGGRAGTQWSWLKTLLLYKVNPYRKARMLGLLNIVTTPTGAAVTVEDAAADETEEPWTPVPAMLETPPSKRSRTAGSPASSSSRTLQEVQGRVLPMKAPPPVMAPLAVTSKAPGPRA